MGTMNEELDKAGLKGSVKAREVVDRMKKKYTPIFCNKCGERITFRKEKGAKRAVPYEDSGIPHYEKCPFNNLAQKKAAYNILRKLLVYMIHKHGDKFEDSGLYEHERKICTAIADKELNRATSG